MNPKPQLCRAHPLMIFRYLKPFVFILLIPTAQGLFQYVMTGRFTSLIVGESVTAGLLIAYSILKFFCCRVEVAPSWISVQEGVLLRREAVIPTDRISSAFVRTGPLLWLTRSVEVQLNTETGRDANADFTIIVSRKNASLFLELLPAAGESDTYHMPGKRVILMAAATSSSAAGLLLAAPVVQHAGKLLGAGFTEKLYDTIAATANFANRLIPPIAGLLAILLAAGFAISFGASLLKNLPFRLTRKGRRLTAVAGTVLRRRTTFLIDSIHNISVLQNPLLLALRRYNVKICVAGFGNYKGETAVLVPTADRNEMGRMLTQLFPGVSLAAPRCKARPDALRRFYTVPTLYLLGVALLALWLTHCLPAFGDLIWFVATIAETLVLLAFVLRYRAFQRGGLTLGKQVCAVGRRSLFTLQELRCPGHRVGTILMYQYPTDRRAKLCRVRVTVRSQNADHVTAALLDQAQVERELESFLEIMASQDTNPQKNS